jgi:hypothetical protein
MTDVKDIAQSRTGGLTALTCAYLQGHKVPRAVWGKGSCVETRESTWGPWSLPGDSGNCGKTKDAKKVREECSGQGGMGYDVQAHRCASSSTEEVNETHKQEHRVWVKAASWESKDAGGKLGKALQVLERKQILRWKHFRLKL